jgi:magnesium transporter
MIHAYYLTHNGQLRTDVTKEDLLEIKRDSGGLLWVDLDGEPIENCEQVLLGIFGFHPLAVDDALHQTHIPKVDDWGDYLFLVFYNLQYLTSDELSIQTQELDIFLGKHYLVTYHNQPVPTIERIRDTCQRDKLSLSKGTAYLLYQLLDDMIAHYMDVVEEVNQEIDLIEDQVFTNPKPATLDRIFTLKRTLLHLRRLLVPQREVLYKLSRIDFQVFDVELGIFFRDVYDHAARLEAIIESLRDLAGSALEMYLLIINNRMNEVMKTLTIITTLFMPLAFITGFFGMNFFQATLPLEAWTGKFAFVITTGLIILVPVGMYLWMRKRAWM